MESPLKGKWVLITGASSGFGAAAAAAFGFAGARLLLGARRVTKLRQTAAAARRAGAPEAHSHALDVSSTASVESFVSWATGKIQRRGARDRHLHILINNAGGAHGLEPVAEGRDEDWETMLQTNVLGVLRMTRAALPLMLGRPGGAIINIGSVASREAYVGGAAYCAAKAGELQITRTLRLELCGTGLRVCSVDPGLAETEFSLVRFKGDAARARQLYENVQPLTASDVAEILVWVANRPEHVCVDELVVRPTAQASMNRIHRGPPVFSKTKS